MPVKTKEIVFSQHALDQLKDRGTTREEVTQTIWDGEMQIAKKERISFKKNFPFEKVWKSRHYSLKQVMPIVVEEKGCYVVITVYVFYFGEQQ